MEIQVLRNEDEPTLPWTFRWKSDGNKKTETEQISHKNNIESLTKVCFGVDSIQTDFVYFFEENNFIFFENSKDKYLKLEFDNKKSKQKKIFEKKTIKK